MSKSFYKELIWANYLLIGGFISMFIIANLYYGASQLVWIRTLPIIVILVLALFLKIRRIKKKGKDLDERFQYLTYRALSIGFYFILAAVLWYYTKEMSISGSLSVRTYVELIAGMIGYLGSLLIFRTKY